MQLKIASEIGRLRAVMVHMPGNEIDRMVPSLMGEWLFDDILYGRRARTEHRKLQRVLSSVADEVLLFHDALVASLQAPEQRASLVKDLRDALALSAEVCEVLAADDAEALAGHVVAGIERPGVTSMPETAHELYLLPPCPNLIFHRDPAVVLGDGVMISSMATKARLREPLLLRHVVQHHSAFNGSKLWLDQFDGDFRTMRSTARPRPCIEGGDVLVPREDVLLVGTSVRTSRRTIEQLAEALHDAKAPFRTLLIVDLPPARSYMHLDTVFTQLSEDKCLVYPPVVLEGGVEQAAVYQRDLTRREPTYSHKQSLLAALKDLGIDLEALPCGGPDDPIAQQREQWTDGANAFALAPGVVLLYKRNDRTAETLTQAGFRILDEDDLLLGKEDLDIDQPTVVLIEGQELSRARGGPRCLTMPLARDPV